MKIRWLLLLILALTLPAYAGMSISPGTPAHTHEDANTGGSTLLPSYINVNPTASATPGAVCIIDNQSVNSSSNANYITGCSNLKPVGTFTIYGSKGMNLVGATNTNFHLITETDQALNGSLECGSGCSADIIEFDRVDTTTLVSAKRWQIYGVTADSETGGDVGGYFSLDGFNDLGNAPAGQPSVTDPTMVGVAVRFYRKDLHMLLGGSLASAKACATGYTRLTPNYCERSAAPVQVASLSAATCTQTTALTGVTDAKGIELQIDTINTSANAVGSRLLDGYVYAPTDTTCGTILFDNANRTYEYVAVAAGTQINQKTSVYKAVSNASGQVYVDAQVALSGTSPTVIFRVLGYYD